MPFFTEQFRQLDWEEESVKNLIDMGDLKAEISVIDTKINDLFLTEMKQIDQKYTSKEESVKISGKVDDIEKRLKSIEHIIDERN